MKLAEIILYLSFICPRVSRVSNIQKLFSYFIVTGKFPGYTVPIVPAVSLSSILYPLDFFYSLAI